MNHIQQGLIDSAQFNGYVGNINWVLLIIAVNFIFEAENIIKKIIKANAVQSIRNSEDVSKTMKGMRKKVTGVFKGK